DPVRRAVPRNPDRLARHDRIVLVRPLIELLNLVPEFGLVLREAVHAKPRRRDPLVLDVPVVLPGLAAGFRLDSAALHLRGTAAAVSAARDRIRGAAPVAGQIRLAVGAARRFDGAGLRSG